MFAALTFLGTVSAQSLGNASFKDSYYPFIGYAGSRVLETNYTAYKHMKVNWTNQVAVDPAGNQWVVDKANHALVLINASDTSFNFVAYGQVVAGTRGTAGYLDGGNAVALFNGPTGVAIFDQSVFVADTLNHCIRKVDMSLLKTTTYAGVPGKAGFLDGDGSVALFSNPSALGVDSATGTLFVLDNVTRVRMLTMTTSGFRTFVNVATLVQGACRAQAAYSYYNLIIKEVWCQTGWEAAPIPAEKITSWQWDRFCVGNTLTCN